MKLISILFALAGMAGCDAEGSIDPNLDCEASCEEVQGDCHRECDDTCISDEDETACVEDCDRECDDDYDSCELDCD
jgi:hypothetical protein